MKLFTTLSAIAFLAIAHCAKAQERNEIAVNGGIGLNVGTIASAHHVLNADRGPQIAYGIEILGPDTVLNIGRKWHIAPGVNCNFPVPLSFGYIYAGVALRVLTTTDFNAFGLTGGPHGGIVVDVHKRFAINAEGGYRLRQKQIGGIGGNFYLATVGLRYKL
jgi:hypothetical protein